MGEHLERMRRQRGMIRADKTQKSENLRHEIHQKVKGATWRMGK